MQRFGALLAVACLSFLPAIANETVNVLGDPAPVRVYTNADLARYEAPATDAWPAAHDDLGWEFVQEFIDREHARIDADRAADLERRRVEQEGELPPPGYGLPYLGLNYGYGYGYGDRCRKPRARPPVAHAGRFGERGSHRGSDAFPVRKLPQRTREPRALEPRTKKPRRIRVH